MQTLKREDDHETAACKRLWAAVVEQAIADAVEVHTISKGTDKAKVKEDAIDFLLTDRSDDVFEMLGINPGVARKAIRRRTLCRNGL